MAMSQSQTHLNRNWQNYLKSLSLKTHTVVDVLQQNWTFFAKIQRRCKQRWTGNPMGIVGNLNLSVMFTCAEMLPKRSDPSTPHVNCFHFVRDTEGCWDDFFFLKIYHRECNYSYTLSVHLFPWDAKHTDPQTVSSQRVRNSCHFQVSDHRYLRHDKTLFSSAELVCYLAARVFLRLLWSSFPVSAEATQKCFHLWRRWNGKASQSLTVWLPVFSWKVRGKSKTCPVCKVFMIRWELCTFPKDWNVTTLKPPSSQKCVFLLFPPVKCLRFTAQRLTLLGCFTFYADKVIDSWHHKV